MHLGARLLLYRSAAQSKSLALRRFETPEGWKQLAEWLDSAHANRANHKDAKRLVDLVEQCSLVLVTYELMTTAKDVTTKITRVLKALKKDDKTAKSGLTILFSCLVPHCRHASAVHRHARQVDDAVPRRQR